VTPYLVPDIGSSSRVKQQTPIPKRLYTFDEAAIYLGRSVWSVRRLVWKGLLAKVEAGGRIHIDVHDMDQFIDRNKVREEDVA
jgi:hypothetical protein